MPVRLNGSTSGYTELSAPAVAGNNSIALPTGNGSTYQIVRNSDTAGSLEFADKIVSGTAVASTSGTSINFTGIPSWAKRVTVMFNGVSTNGTSNYLVQLGAGSITTTGYSSYFGYVVNDAAASSANVTNGLGWWNGSAATTDFGHYIITLVSGNTWVSHCCGASIGGTAFKNGGGAITLSGTLDRVRITTVNGTDTFDAGSINILWE